MGALNGMKDGSGPTRGALVADGPPLRPAARDGLAARVLRVLLVLLVPALSLSGCASPGAARLASLGSAPPGFGDVIVYRAPARFAAEQSFDVLVDERPAGALGDASALWLRLSTGSHRIAVVPDGARQAAQRTIWIEEGRRQWLQYDFASGVMANAAMVGSALRIRDEDEVRGLVDRLRWSGDEPTARSSARSGALAQAPRPRLAGSRVPVDDIDALPIASDALRAGYRAWLRRPTPRAFVVAEDGAWHASWGSRSVERAIQACREGGHAQCRLYAVDHRVVWETH